MDAKDIDHHDVTIEIDFSALRQDNKDKENVLKWLSTFKVTMNERSIVPGNWIETNS